MKRRFPLRRSAGQSSTEYLVVLFFAVLLLITGDPSPLERVFDALKLAYERFTYSMSVM